MNSADAEHERIGNSAGQAAIDMGREALAAWDQAQPDNYFSADLNFQRSLEYHWGREAYSRHLPSLYAFGALAATEIDAAVREAAGDPGFPRLERYDAWGRRTEEVQFHPSHHRAGRLIFGSGMLGVYESPGNNLLSLALFYLSSQNGEAGHNCALACTAGVIKALRAVADSSLSQRFLPRLLDPDYDNLYQGAQFLTEVQGGSDVGANGTVATLVDEDQRTWLLDGEKWFCSNTTADVALVTARVPGQGEGTRGLGLFLAPRVLPDGSLNNIFIHRLKDKLGTRTLATAELTLERALAYQVGPTKAGFKNTMSYVINTSRIYNAVGVCGNARRATQVAMTYAQHRLAFGRPIVHFPLVQDQLANMRATSAAILAGTLQIVSLLDEIEVNGSSAEAEGLLRMALNLNKYRSSVLAHEVIMTAIELLGGNGAVETFSVLPRLLRDNVVYENWEGTHNVLLDQVHRDIRKLKLHQPFFTAVRQLLSSAEPVSLSNEGLALLSNIEAELEEVLAMDVLTGAIYFRPLMDRLMDLYYAACLAAEGTWEKAEKKDRTKERLALLYFMRRAAGRAAKDIAYYDDQVSRLSQ
jgi:acyl-CoA dehydrogenase